MKNLFLNSVFFLFHLAISSNKCTVIEVQMWEYYKLKKRINSPSVPATSTNFRLSLRIYYSVYSAPAYFQLFPEWKTLEQLTAMKVYEHLTWPVMSTRMSNFISNSSRRCSSSFMRESSAVEYRFLLSFSDWFAYFPNALKWNLPSRSATINNRFICTLTIRYLQVPSSSLYLSLPWPGTSIGL